MKYSHKMNKVQVVERNHAKMTFPLQNSEDSLAVRKCALDFPYRKIWVWLSQILCKITFLFCRLTNQILQVLKATALKAKKSKESFACKIRYVIFMSLVMFLSYPQKLSKREILFQPHTVQDFVTVRN